MALLDTVQCTGMLLERPRVVIEDDRDLPYVGPELQQRGAVLVERAMYLFERALEYADGSAQRRDRAVQGMKFRHGFSE